MTGKITQINGSNVIHLNGFKTDDGIIIDDSENLGNLEKVDVVIAEDMLKFLITDRGLLNFLENDKDVDVNVW